MKSRLIPGLITAAIGGALNVTFAVSLAALIFTGRYSKHLAAGVGIALAASTAVVVAGALRSGARPVIYGVQEKPAIFLAMIASALGERVSEQALLPSLLVAFAAASIGTGAVLVLVGYLRLGKLVRYIPYPVVGGFLAGTGWLLLFGSLSVLAGQEVSLSRLSVLLAPGAPARWVPGVAFALALLFGLKRWRHHLALPVMILAAIGLFYGGLAALGVSMDEAFRRGLLMGPFDQAASFPPVALSELGRADLRAIAAQWGAFATIAIISVLSTLLFTSGYEVATGKELDLDRELGATGTANIASGLVMGWPGFIGMGGTLLGHKLGARGRWPGVAAGVVCVLPLLIGMRAFGYLPKAMLAGLLLWTGLMFLEETIIEKAGKLPWREWLLMTSLLALVALLGFLPAIGAGILMATVLFAVSYAGVGVVRARATGQALRSRAARTELEIEALDEEGDRLHVLMLQGYLFFGTSHALLEDARARLTGEEPARYIVLDFRYISGVDSSAVQSFQRLQALAKAAGAEVVLAALPSFVERALRRAGVAGEDRDAGQMRVCADLDRALQLCEDALIAAAAGKEPSPAAVARERARAERTERLLAAIAGHAERVEVEGGDEVYRRGDASDDLVIVESGELDAFISRDGQDRRLRSMGPGSVVGEVGLYLGEARSATVRAARRSVLYRLRRSDLSRLAAESPGRAAIVHEAIATMLAGRLARATGGAEAWIQ